MTVSLLAIALGLAGLHGPLFLFAWARWRGLLAFNQLALAAAVGACAQLVLTAYALSAARLLTPALWLALNLLAAGVWTLLACRTGAALDDLWAAIRERARLARAALLSPVLLAALAFPVLGVVLLVAKAWIYPSYDWDGVNAHLPMARQMLQERGAPLQLSPVPRTAFSPFVPHIFYAATLSLPRGYEWANGANVYFLLLALLAQYAFVRRLGQRRSVALLVSPAVLFCPVLFQQATSNYIDLTVAAFIGASLPFIPSRRESAVVETVLAGLALGLAAGSKESMLLLAPLLGLVVLSWAWWWRVGVGPGRLLAPLAALGAAIFLLGGYRAYSDANRSPNPIQSARGIRLKVRGDSDRIRTPIPMESDH